MAVIARGSPTDPDPATGLELPRPRGLRSAAVYRGARTAKETGHSAEANGPCPCRQAVRHALFTRQGTGREPSSVQLQEGRPSFQDLEPLRTGKFRDRNSGPADQNRLRSDVCR